MEREDSLLAKHMYLRDLFYETMQCDDDEDTNAEQGMTKARSRSPPPCRLRIRRS